MQTGMTIGSAAALMGAMAVLASIPSISVLAVSARAASPGFLHGAFTALGVVAGDICFILLAIFGLALLAEVMGELFFLVRYLGGVYLIWLGIGLWRSRDGVISATAGSVSSLFSSFMTGLLITLADQKAILFYLGFLPAFVDLSRVSYLDAGIIIAITVLSVGSVKLGYAYLAHRAGMQMRPRAGRIMHMAAAGVMTAVGVFLLVSA